MPVEVEKLVGLVEEVRGGSRLRVYVKPESPEEKLVLEGGELVFYTSEPPVQGRANAALVRFLSKALRVSRADVEIVRGLRDRVKLVRVEGLGPGEVAARLAEVVEER
ncbi:MAG: DUF167 domain-containing protein [Desulfurococcales archaeon]|nr:DUF167 domain-containing protein [Desulfurococcales archaeon]